MSKQRAIGIHTAPDNDVVVSIWLLEEYGDKTMKKARHLFLKGGDEALNPLAGITLVDRGRGEFDHHGRLARGETSASLIAKKLGVTEDKNIQQLLGLVKRSDLQGISSPFDIADIIKCIQRNNKVSDEEKVRIGIRVVNDVMEFRKLKLQRNNHHTQKIIVDFLKGKRIPGKFLNYLEKLDNPQFQRPFDFVEILVAEWALQGKAEAINFVQELLELEHKDASLFYEAKREVKKAMEIKVKDQVIIAGVSENPKFNTAARAEGATVIIQRRKDGHNQVYFNTEKVDDILVDSIASMVRLEECLIQDREIPNKDLRWGGKIEEIPEWYYYKAPAVGKKKPGRFILNGSLTAPDVPVSKIPLETLFYIIQCAARYQPFNWIRWKAERIAYYQNQKGKGNA